MCTVVNSVCGPGAEGARVIPKLIFLNTNELFLGHSKYLKKPIDYRYIGHIRVYLPHRNVLSGIYSECRMKYIF